MTSALLMFWQNESKVLRVVNGVEHGQDRTTWISKDMLDALSEHHLMENLSSTESDK